MKRILVVFCSFLLLFSVALSFSSCKEQADTPVEETVSDENTPAPVAASSYTVSAESTAYVLFEVEGFGSFIVELLPEYAPETVANFQKLVGEGFYDGSNFHRVLEGFVIQGGAPTTEKTAPDAIKGEFAANGYEQNVLSHTRGVISMARATDPNSATSQFFVVLKDSASTSLDGKYAAFGRVIEGMDVVDAIAAVPVTTQNYSAERSKPIDPPVIASARFIVWETSETAQ